MFRSGYLLRVVYRTERLVVREMVPSDAAWLYAFESDPENVRYQSYAARTEAGCAQFVSESIAAQTASPRPFYELAVDCDRVSVGRVGFMAIDEGRQGLIWYSFGRVHWGRGYATEAVRGLITFAFGLGLHRIQAECDPRNRGSVGVLRRLGLRQEAHRVRSYWSGSEWCDSFEFAVLREEWVP